MYLSSSGSSIRGMSKELKIPAYIMKEAMLSIMGGPVFSGLIVRLNAVSAMYNFPVFYPMICPEIFIVLTPLWSFLSAYTTKVLEFESNVSHLGSA